MLDSSVPSRSAILTQYKAFDGAFFPLGAPPNNITQALPSWDAMVVVWDFRGKGESLEGMFFQVRGREDVLRHQQSSRHVLGGRLSESTV